MQVLIAIAAAKAVVRKASVVNRNTYRDETWLDGIFWLKWKSEDPEYPEVDSRWL
jgi:hypothetical protein